MTYKLQCQCGTVKLSLSGAPRVRAFCHCVDCRALLHQPYHAVTAWNAGDVSVDAGAESVSVYAHPVLQMQKHFCRRCGDVLFNTNSLNWRVVSQWLIAHANGGELPYELSSTRHFFYEQRVVSINDDLPKYLRGTDGPLAD